MTRLKPWAKGPFELLRHAEGHYRETTDFDRRIALVTYDNAIEISITTYLSLHPDQRGGVEFEKKRVADWLVNYHNKLDFLFGYLNDRNLSHTVPKDEIIYSHKLRNELYHEGRGLVPTREDVDGIRQAAMWVFSSLFGVEVEAQLEQPEVQRPIPDRGHASIETEFLGVVVDLQRKLTALLDVVGDKDSAGTRNISESWTALENQFGELPDNYDEAIEQVSETKDAIVRGESVPSDVLEEASANVAKVAAHVERQLRDFQQDMIQNALVGSKRAILSQTDKRAGAILQTQGSGLTLTMYYYIMRLLDLELLPTPLVIVVTERKDLAYQAFEAFAGEAAHSNVRTKLIQNSRELEWSLEHEHQCVIFATIQEFRSLPPIKTERSDLVIVGYELHSTGQYLASMMSILPAAIRILFAGAHQISNEQLLAVFGPNVFLYRYTDALRSGVAVNVSVESRSVSLSDENLHSAYNDKLLSSFAEDIVRHFESRIGGTDGKAMVIARNRLDVVRLYQEIVRLRPQWQGTSIDEGRVKPIVAENYRDPEDLRQYTWRQDELRRLAEIYRDPQGNIQLIITAGLWIAGLDVPDLRVLYLCRKVSTTSLLQMVARLSRLAPDKKEALLVDYGYNSEVLDEVFRRDLL